MEETGGAEVEWRLKGYVLPMCWGENKKEAIVEASCSIRYICKFILIVHQCLCSLHVSAYAQPCNEDYYFFKKNPF